MSGLRSAIGLLTTVPVARDVKAASDWCESISWYAPVGLGLGCALAAVAAGAWWLLPAPAAAAVVVAAWVALTGALHIDGLADTADAAFAPASRSRRLEILRDVHHGTFGTTAVVVVLLLKFGVLFSFGARDAAALVIVAATVSRGLVAPAMRIFPSARPEGMGAASRPGASMFAVISAVALAAFAAAGALSWGGLAAVGIATVAGGAGAAWLSSRFGGLTGDCYGALIEFAEVSVIVAGAALLEHDAAASFPLGWPG